MTDKELMQQAQLETLEGTLWILNQELTRKQVEIDALQKLMRQALEALENAEDQLAKPYSTEAGYAITALRQALGDKHD